MKIKAILFDLDGTLLPMDQDIFIKAYIGGLVKAAIPAGFEPKALATAIQAGTYAMVKNNGEETNEKVFWDYMRSVYGGSIEDDLAFFEEFYRTDFQKVSEVCGKDPQVKKLVDFVKSKGFRTALATNPLFPTIATESRIRWAGLEVSDFEFFTSFENSRHSKPNPDYYREVIERIGLAPEECLMVGNDADEDTVAASLGMTVFLLTDCLINKSGKDISVYPNGNIADLFSFIENLEK